jgi:hypothetical protein
MKWHLTKWQLNKQADGKLLLTEQNHFDKMSNCKMVFDKMVAHQQAVDKCLLTR